MDNSIIKSCLLGLHTKKINFEVFPELVFQHLDTSKDQTSCFLDALVLQTAYNQAGKSLDKVANISVNIPICEDEITPYTTESAKKALRVIFLEGGYSIASFLPLLIKNINTSGKLIHPEFIAYLLPLLNGHLKELKSETIIALGKRGQWIYELANPSNNKESTEVSFLDLKSAERNNIISIFLENNQEKALLFLKELFPIETPASQLRYLKYINLSTISAPVLPLILKNI